MFLGADFFCGVTLSGVEALRNVIAYAEPLRQVCECDVLSLRETKQSFFKNFFIFGHERDARASVEGVSGNRKTTINNNHKLKQTAFYIGLVLIAISFIACVVSLYFLVIGIPTFLVGTILIFLSEQNIKTKLLTTVIPLILYVPSTFLFLYSYNYSKPKTILIPKDFEGNLRVVYEENCGRNYDRTGGIKTLTFPDNGILILNEDFDRHVNYNYYLVDRLGNRTKIFQILDFKDEIQKRPCVLVGGSGTIEQTIEANSTNQEERDITFTDFYIYNKDTVERNDFKSQQKFDSLTTEIVNQCRKNNGSH